MKATINLIIILGLLLTACKPVKTGNEFKDLCREDGNVWMKVQPIKDGVRISEEACDGCMIEDNHVCDIEEYNKIKAELEP